MFLITLSLSELEVQSSGGAPCQHVRAPVSIPVAVRDRTRKIGSVALHVAFFRLSVGGAMGSWLQARSSYTLPNLCSVR